jgi:hypothetical protein
MSDPHFLAQQRLSQLNEVVMSAQAATVCAGRLPMRVMVIDDRFDKIGQILIGLAFILASGVMALVERNDQNHTPPTGTRFPDDREGGSQRP